MCACSKGKKQANTSVNARSFAVTRSSGGTMNNTATANQNWILVRYYNPSAVTPIRVYDFMETPRNYLGKVTHGSYLNAPPEAVGFERLDGSMFVLPENFEPVISFAVEAEAEPEIEQPTPKTIRKKAAK